MDMIGKTYPPFSKQHCFILVVTDYFIKWIEAKPYKIVDQTEAIDFIKELIYRFGILETITTDNETVFDRKLVKAFAAEFIISLVNFSPYHAQTNGQAESSKKSLKKGIQRVVEDNPRDWHNLLLDVLWAYRISQISSTGVTPYAVLLMEINIKSLRVKC